MDLGQRVAIVGSRQRADRQLVRAAVAALPPGSVVISGGARGPDTWAVESAREHDLEVVVHLPDLEGAATSFEVTRRYYARNQRLVDDCQRVIAFVSPDRRGGTEDTIRRARRAGKPIEVR